MRAGASFRWHQVGGAMQSGEVLNERFEIGELAGTGGMGEVHRALDRTTGRYVAVKLLYRRGIRDLLRFEREARCLAALDHPGIVRYLDHLLDARHAYLVMEWLEGETLAARLARSRLTLAESVALASRIADGLAAAHAAGVVHRDLKPSNIFLVEGSLGLAKIIDFGLARGDGAGPPITATGATLGTPGYMAPEQAHRPRDVDHRADIFSLGCVLFHCVTGKPPYEGDSVSAVVLAASADAPRASSFADGVPPLLDDLVARMLSRSPDQRPTDVVGELRALDADIRAQRIGWNVPQDRVETPSTLVNSSVDTTGKSGPFHPSPMPPGASVDPRGSTVTPEELELRARESGPANADARLARVSHPTTASQPTSAPQPTSSPDVAGVASSPARMHPATAALLTILAVMALFGACCTGCLYCTCLAPAGTNGARPPPGPLDAAKDAGRAPPARSARPSPH